MGLIHCNKQADQKAILGFAQDTLNGMLQMADLHAYPREIFQNNANGLPIYIGLNTNADADKSTSTDWIIIKANYSGTSVVDRQIKIGTWDGRTGLGWAF